MEADERPIPEVPEPPPKPGLTAAGLGASEGAASYGALHQRMVERYAPPSLLVGPDDEVVHLSERVGRYLAFPSGGPTTSVSRLVRTELRSELRAALGAARERGQPTRSKPVTVQVGGEPRSVALDVRPALEPPQEGLTLVLFDEREADPSEGARAAPPRGVSEPASGAQAGRVRVREPEAELDLARQRLQALVEEHGASQEEMRASNEELRSMNEELRSTLEELETSKEELQSMNEELQTLNQENKHRVEELAQLSADLQHLMAATDIATLFLDRRLRILRFTPKVGDLFSMRMTDRGRPLSDLTHRLGYDELGADAEAVLRDLVPVEREVQDEGGRWYLTRVRPYRSSGDGIEGVVITFVDITERRRAEEELHRLNETLEEQARQVRGLAHRLTVAEQEERRRISRVLHDDLQQLLYGVEMTLSAIREDLLEGERPRLTADLEGAHSWIAQAITMTRHLTVDLSPPILRREGLADALAWLQRQMGELHGLEVALEAEHGFPLPDDDLRVLLFQVVRELLFNVKKHAGTGRAAVRLTEEGGHLVIRVVDEGCGFDAAEVAAREEPSGGFGLYNVRERLGLLGGRLEVRSRPGGGTHVEVHAPDQPELQT